MSKELSDNIDNLILDPGNIEASVWVKRGSMLQRRDYLSPDDPESWESLWFNKYGSLQDFPFEEVYKDEDLRMRRMLRTVPTELLKAELLHRAKEEHDEF